MKLSTLSRINVLNNTKDTSLPQTIEEAAEQKNVLKNRLEAIKLSGFFTPGYKGSTDFVDERDIDNFFEQLSHDLEAVGLSLSLIEQRLAETKDTIKQGYQNVQSEMNSLQSKINSLALYNNAAFSNIHSLLEDFSSDAQILQQDQPLNVNKFAEKLSLKYSNITPVDISKAGIALNQSKGGIATGELKNIIDGNDTTYFEYFQSASGDSLVLDFTITLPQAEVINQIGINPNNLQTQNWLALSDITTSLDGITYTSIFSTENFYRKYLFENADEDSGRVLSSQKNGGASYFNYDFQPVRARYIRVILKQLNLHPISDDFRIALNDVKVNRVSYTAQGSIIIEKPIDPKTITALALHVRQQSLIDSPLLKVEYQVSFDKQTWYEIQPVKSNGSKRELLTFNSPWLSDSIDLSNAEGDRVYLKVNMSKVMDENTIKSVVSSYSIPAQEYFTFPDKAPYTFKLSKPAASNDVSLYAMPYIGIGKKDFDRLTLGITEKGKYYYKYKLPFNPYGAAKFYLGTDELTEFSGFNLMFDTNLLGYFLNTEDNTVHIALPRPLPEPDKKASDPLLVKPSTIKPPLKTGGGDELGDELEISVRMTPVNIKTASRFISLKYTSDGIKDNFTVYKINGDAGGNPIISDVYDIIPAGQKRIQLSSHPLENKIIEIEGCHRIKFLDGVGEFIDTSEYAYSIDFSTNTLYLKNSFDSVTRSIHYQHEEKWKLSQDDFLLKDLKTVEIREWVFDPKMYYKIEYNMSIPLPASSYSVQGDTVKLSDTEIINLINGNSVYANRNLQAVYKFQEVLSDVVAEMADYLTPIVNDITITYSK